MARPGPQRHKERKKPNQVEKINVYVVSNELLRNEFQLGGEIFIL